MIDMEDIAKLGQEERIAESLSAMFWEWCRLKGYEKLETPIALEFDKATSRWKDRVSEFLDFVCMEVLNRRPVA